MPPALQLLRNILMRDDSDDSDSEESKKEKESGDKEEVVSEAGPSEPMAKQEETTSERPSLFRGRKTKRKPGMYISLLSLL